MESPPAVDSQPAPRRTSRLRRRLRICLLALLLCPVLLEGVLRLLLFHPSTLAATLGHNLRNASFYTPDEADSNYWKLRYHFTPARERSSPPIFHPRLGWIDGQLRGPELRNAGWDPADTRRPVLLYGASFAGCATKTCFQDLLEASELSQDHVLINYGIGGYGLDQMTLLFEQTIDAYQGRDPIVIFAPVLESDLDRCSVDFRGWPKPAFELRYGELREPSLIPEDPEPYLDHRPVNIKSYLWRYLLHGSQWLPREWRMRLAGRTQRRNAQRKLIARIVERLQAGIEERNLELGFLLFHAKSTVLPGREPGWQERHLVAHLENLGIVHHSTRPALRAAGEVAGLYIAQGLGRNHLNEAGNAAAFEVLQKTLQELASAAAPQSVNR